LTAPNHPPPVPRRRRWWPPTPGQTLAFAVLVVAVVVAVVLSKILNPPIPNRCDPGLQDERGGGTEGHQVLNRSCIGVTDSSDFEDPGLTEVMARIAEQNHLASGSGDFYSLGYLLPLEPLAQRTSLSAELRHELEGAALAQAETNGQDGTKIKLLVANAGPDNAHWQAVTNSLQAAADGPDRLRAVAGFGNSIEATKEAIRALTQPGPPGEGPGPVAAIGTRLTADNLSFNPDDRQIEGFFRVAPTNADEATTAVALIRQRQAVRPMLVSDRNMSDAYVDSLGRAFRDAFGNPQMETFNGAQDALPSAFETVTLNLCAEPQPDAVYFAGRGEALAAFVRKLAGRNCGDTPVNIVTGDDIAGLRDAAAMGDSSVVAALGSNVTVTYTGLAHPDLWASTDPGASFNTGAVAYLRSAQLDLSDGAAIMGHDAVLLAITAIQRAAGPERAPVTASAMIQTLYGVRGAAAMAGASGPISLTECGDAERKLFPILSITPSGMPVLIGPAYAAGNLQC